MKKKVLLIATGGTIASQDKGFGLLPAIDGKELLKFVPEIESLCRLTAVQPLNFDSLNINPNHWLKIANEIEKNYDAYDGFIICHGTDTLGYTAAALSYLVQNASKPIIITGAQKPIDANITDAKRNLLDAVRLAVSSIKGVYAVFDGKVIIGTRARKVMTKSYAAFESINYPSIGTMGRSPFIEFFKESLDEDVKFYKNLCHQVCLLKLTPGVKPDLLRYAAENYKAVLIESFGAGGLPQNEYIDFLQELSTVNKDTLLFIGTQAANEGTDMKVTEIGRKAIEKGLFEVYDMLPETAVVKLMWALGNFEGKNDIIKNFYKPVHWDISVNL